MLAKDQDIETKNKQKIQAGFDAWRNGTGSPFDLLAPNAKWTIVGNAPVSRTYNSKQEFMDVVIKPFNARMSQRAMLNAFHAPDRDRFTQLDRELEVMVGRKERTIGALRRHVKEHKCAGPHLP